MNKCQRVANQIQRLIREQRLGPGDRLPSERCLASQLGVAYATVRLANDYLIRQGVIDRRHGQGTFVAQGRSVANRASLRRIGLLYVDTFDQESTHLRNLTFQVQRAAGQAGYELVVEPVATEDLLHGVVPDMLTRQSVDGVLLYSHVRDHHVKFIEDHGLPYIVLGNRPITVPAPQARIDVEGMAYQLSRELLKAGRRPVWYDVDVNNKRYHPGQEQLQGYLRASHEFGDGSLHLCSLRIRHLGDTVEKLCRAGLRGAAIIAQDLAAGMLVPALALKTADWQDLLIAPQPVGAIPDLDGPNVVRWTCTRQVPSYAYLGARCLLDALTGVTEQVHSVTVEFTCRMESPAPVPQMNFESTARYSLPQPAGGGIAAAIPAGRGSASAASTRSRLMQSESVSQE